MPSQKKIQDILDPREKRSIRNIPLTAKQDKELQDIEAEEKIHPPKESMNEPAFYMAGRDAFQNNNGDNGASVSPPTRGRIFVWTAAVIVLITLGISIAHAFAKATVSIVRSSEPITLSATAFSLASRANFSSTSTIPTTLSNDSILYTTSVITVVATSSIDAAGLKAVQTKASGTITITNKSAQEQKLISTTRLETTSGLIYRLNSTVTVPAGKSINVLASADQTGTAYNGAGIKLSFSSFKGTAKYTSITAVAATMSGGATGKIPQTSAEDLVAAKGLLQLQIADKADVEGQKVVPNGMTYIPRSSIISYQTVVQSYDAASKSAILSQTAKVTLVFLDKETLYTNLAKQNQSFDASSSIPMTPIADTTALTASIDTGLSQLKLSGTATIEEQLSEKDIAASVSHLSREEALRVIQHIPGVEGVDISLSPWWEKNLPSSDKVKVTVE